MSHTPPVDSKGVSLAFRFHNRKIIRQANKVYWLRMRLEVEEIKLETLEIEKRVDALERPTNE